MLLEKICQTLSERAFFISMLAFIILSFWAIASNSYTYDEPTYYYAALEYFSEGFKKIVELQHPPLAQMALYFPEFVAKSFGIDLSEKSILLARGVNLIFSLLMLFFAYFFSKKIFGEKFAKIFAVFLAFSPEIIAHASLATIDLQFTFYFFGAIFSFYLARKISTKFYALSGICTILCVFSKVIGLLLFPILLLIAFSEFFSAKEKKRFLTEITAIAIFGIALLISISMVYGFGGFFEKKIYGIPLPFPQNFAEKISIGVERTNGSIDRLAGQNILLGQKYSNANPAYYLIAMLAKYPIPLILLFLIGIFYTIREKNKILRDFAIIFAAIVLFFSSYPIQIGIRYILPVYPLFVSISAFGALKLFEKNQKKIAFFLIAWLVVSTLLIAPNFLAYFNELAGGPMNGYKFLADSNLDWGQEWHLAKDFLKKNPGSKEQVPCIKTSGKYLVSANDLYDIWGGNCHNWLKNEIPKQRIGYTYFYYEIN